MSNNEDTDDDLNCSDCNGVIWHEVLCPVGMIEASIAANRPTNSDGTTTTSVITLDPNKVYLFLLPFESDNEDLVADMDTKRRDGPMWETNYPGLLAAAQIAIHNLKVIGYQPVSLKHSAHVITAVGPPAPLGAFSMIVPIDPDIRWPVPVCQHCKAPVREYTRKLEGRISFGKHKGPCGLPCLGGGNIMGKGLHFHSQTCEHPKCWNARPPMERL